MAYPHLSSLIFLIIIKQAIRKILKIIKISIILRPDLRFLEFMPQTGSANQCCRFAQGGSNYRDIDLLLL
jgi:hypothetical protein